MYEKHYKKKKEKRKNGLGLKRKKIINCTIQLKLIKKFSGLLKSKHINDLSYLSRVNFHHFSSIDGYILNNFDNRYFHPVITARGPHNHEPLSRDFI